MKRKYHKSMHKYKHTLTSSQVQSMPSIHTKPFQHTYRKPFWPLAAALMGTTPIWMLVGQTPRIRKASPGRDGTFLLGMGAVPYSKNFWVVVVLPEDKMKHAGKHQSSATHCVRNVVLFGRHKLGTDRGHRMQLHSTSHVPPINSHDANSHVHVKYSCFYQC